jgi:stalled ribosome alternative rescue factor ArfA
MSMIIISPSFGARIDRPKKGKYRRKLKQHPRRDLRWRRS